jgi:predicted SnoaL-like aldol condensation-catalyzing enzyme
MTSEFIDRPGRGGNTASMTDNKSIVQRAFAVLLETGDVDVLASSLRDDFVHHRPGTTARTKQEWLAAVRAAQEPLAGMQVEVARILADGDHVVVHTSRRLPGGGPEIAVVDIIRLDDGLVAEAWEIIEPVSEVAANQAWWKTRSAAAAA